MRHATAVATSILSTFVLGVSVARAEPIVVASTSIATSGWFDCRSSIACSGEGTNSVTFGSGSNTATVTFTGVNSTFDVMNTRVPVTLGTFQVTASDGFAFPTHPANPEQPVLRFFLTTRQTLPISRTSVREWQFGPGGRATLPVEIGSGYVVLSLDRNASNYSSTVFTFNPFPFSLARGTTSLTADAGAVPEPATMVLLGTGLMAVAAAARRRRPN